MPLSRLRVRLAGTFALSFLVGLMALNLGLFLYLRHRADLRLTRQLEQTARQLAEAVNVELSEPDQPTLPHAAHAALEEFPASADAFMVTEPSGALLEARGPQALLERVAPLPPLTAASTVDRPVPGAVPLRISVVPTSGRFAFTVIAVESTYNLTEEIGSLAWWLALSVPGVAIIGLGIGYVLARGALRPIDDLGSAIAAVDPSDLTQRLPVGDLSDEVNRVTAQVNGLLQRLESAQHQNRSFILRAAHQIRTPLTLLMGESALALDRPRDDEQYRQALRRVQLAAGQMRHRVEELQLLAQAEAGERPQLHDQVELDGLLLECSDLMRARAMTCGRTLEFGEVQPLIVRGNEHLLREAVVELLENACRHAIGDHPIRLTCTAVGAEALVQVTSPGPDASQHVATAAPREDGTGLGLAIVRWIAEVHGGSLRAAFTGRDNEITLALRTA